MKCDKCGFTHAREAPCLEVQALPEDAKSFYRHPNGYVYWNNDSFDAIEKSLEFAGLTARHLLVHGGSR